MYGHLLARRQSCHARWLSNHSVLVWSEQWQQLYEVAGRRLEVMVEVTAVRTVAVAEAMVGGAKAEAAKAAWKEEAGCQAHTLVG